MRCARRSPWALAVDLGEIERYHSGVGSGVWVRRGEVFAVHASGNHPAGTRRVATGPGVRISRCGAAVST